MIDEPIGRNGPETDQPSGQDSSGIARAMIDTVEAIVRAETIKDIIHLALETIRREFGWAYGSYWAIDSAQKALVFKMESGEVDAEFAPDHPLGSVRDG